MELSDWDDAYENSAYIKGSEHYSDTWAKLAHNYRKTNTRMEISVAYGSEEREKYDLFHPPSESKGLLVFVHGGYWMMLDKSSWSHLAAGACEHGLTVAIPSYTLVPEYRIADITRQISSAIIHSHKRVGGPIYLAGHSAGGHLVSRMLCSNGPLPITTATSIESVVSISGVHDLRPLLRTRMNETLGLDSQEAAAESPCLDSPIVNADYTTWVGSLERPEFLRQSQLMTSAWPGTDCVVDTGQHHFSVVDGLADPRSNLIRKLLNT